MKTPREILLQRHRAAESKLDAIRQNVVASEFALQKRSTPSPPLGERVGVRGWALACWQELIWPCRRVWGGLAATWVVVICLNLSTSTTPELASTVAPAPGPGVVAALREQRQLLTQLLEPFTPAPPARAKTPGTRGALPRMIKFG